MSFQEDIDEAFDTTEKEEDWIEYIKRSTKEAEEYMKKKKIPCRIETHRRLKWRMASRIASLPEERWNKKSSIGTVVLTTDSKQEEWLEDTT